MFLPHARLVVCYAKVVLMLLPVPNVPKDIISILKKHVYKFVTKDSMEILLLKPVSNVTLHV